MFEIPPTFLITDGRADLARLGDLLRAALDGGIRGVQIREPRLSARDLAALCSEWKTAFDTVDGLLMINDRVDVAAAGLTHGVHLGHRSLPPCTARAILPETSVIGFSVHDAEQMAGGAAADYFVLAPLFETTSKPLAQPLGLERARDLLVTRPRPTILLGGIDASNAGAAREIGGQGVAVMSAVCNATDPRAAAAELVATERVEP